MRLRPSAALLALAVSFAASAVAQDTAPALSIEQVMARPGLDRTAGGARVVGLGRPARAVRAQARRQRGVRDTFEQALGGAAARRVGDGERAALDAARPAFDAQRQRMAFVRNGDVFVRDLRSGALTQLTRSNDEASQPRFSADGGVFWRVGNQWYRWSQESGVTQAALLKAEKDPEAKPKADALREQQLRTIDTLARDRAQREAVQQQSAAWRKSDPSRAPAPVYFGDEVEIVDSALSPDPRWLLVTTRKKSGEAGQAGKMPKYVTESGYEEFQEVRTRVGRNAPAGAHAVAGGLERGQRTRTQVRCPARHRQGSAGGAAQGRRQGRAERRARSAHRKRRRRQQPGDPLER